MRYIIFLYIIFFIGCGGAQTKQGYVDIETNASIMNQKDNLSPVANSQNIVLNHSMSKTITLTASDPEKAILTYNIEENPKNGTLTKISSDTFIYHANEGFLGSDSFIFNVNDGIQSSQSTVVHIVVNTNSPLSSVSNCQYLPKTGQTKSFLENDDGNLQKGITRNYTRDNINGIVTDNITKLMWQDNELVQKPLVTQTNFDAENYEQYSGDTAANYCENLSLGKYMDWRLPTLDELSLLIDFGRINPAIDFTFKNRPPEVEEDIYYQGKISDNYWTSTSHLSIDYNQDDSGRSISFYTGYFTNYKKNIPLSVRCVRGKEREVVDRFIRDDVEDVVYDKKTCLVWQDDSAIKGNSGYGMYVDWYTAMNYCKTLELSSYDDWRLPNVNELKSIMDFNTSIVVEFYTNRTYYATKDAFKNITSTNFWTSTMDVTSSGYWPLLMHFDERSGVTGSPTSGGFSGSSVRCVRSGR